MRIVPLLMVVAWAVTVTSCKKDKEQPEPADTPAEDTATSSDEPAADDQPAAEPTGEEGAPSAEVAEQAEKAIATLERIAMVAETHKGNCDQAASALDKLVAEDQAAIESGQKLNEDPAAASYFRFKYQDRISTAQGRILELMQACEDHAGLAEVFGKIDGE